MARCAFPIIIFLLLAITTIICQDQEIISTQVSETSTEIITEKILKTKNGKKDPVMLNVKQNLVMNQILGIYGLHNRLTNPDCIKHSIQFKEDFRAFEPWALKMFDASSKIQSTILSGNLIDFGGFDQCLSIEEQTNSGVIKGQHCMVEMSPSVKITEILIGYRNLTLKQLYTFTGDTGLVIKWALCVPDTCSAEEVQNHLSVALEGLSEGSGLQIRVRNESCSSVKSKRKFSRGDYAFMIIFGGISAVALFSTLYDLHCRSSAYVPNELYTAFSAYTNTLKLLEPPRATDMNAIYGLRFITMCWIVGGHRYLMFGFFPADNTLDILHWMTKWSSLIIIAGTFSVDTFFVISGLLLSFLFFTKMSKGENFNIILFWIHRYLRLTPAYGFVSLLYATMMTHMGDGPLWNDLMQTVSAPCYDHWWAILLYIQNYVNPADLCSVQTWYLQCDTQLYFLSPLILLPMLKFRTFGLVSVVTLIMASAIVSFKLAWENQYSGAMPVTMILLTTDYFAFHYITTHTRASAWLIGIIVGYIMFRTANKKVKISKTTSFIFWVLSLAIMLGCIFGAHPFLQPHIPYNRMQASLYLSLSRILWSLGLSWILFACANGYGGVLNRFLSLNLFQVWGRLSYSMYLLHMFVQYTIGGRERIQTHYANELNVHQAFGDIIYATILAYICTLLFESPIIILEKKLLGNANKNKQEKIVTKTSNKVGPKNELI